MEVTYPQCYGRMMRKEKEEKIMARAKKPESLEGQLAKVDNDIKTLQEQLKKLKKRKKELEEKIEIEKYGKLKKLIDSSEKTYDDVVEFLENETKKIDL